MAEPRLAKLMQHLDTTTGERQPCCTPQPVASARGLEKRVMKRCGGAEVTFVGFGALEIGRDWGMGPNTARPAEEDSIAVVRHVLDLGINVLDTVLPPPPAHTPTPTHPSHAAQLLAGTT